jgi:bromodomain adjacent to zinc finger domain protein 1A
MFSGSVRLKNLGRDRYYNRYWWFDGAVGAYVPPECFFYDTKGRVRSVKAHNLLDWGMGALFVEDFGLEKLNTAWDEVELDSFKVGNEAGTFGYYSEPIHVSQLQEWLNNNGIRERNLQINLAKIEELITGGMERRTKDLLSREEVKRRDSKTAADFLNYTNKFANES